MFSKQLSPEEVAAKYYKYVKKSLTKYVDVINNFKMDEKWVDVVNFKKDIDELYPSKRMTEFEQIERNSTYQGIYKNT
ncbi:MAG: hypothetical protein JO149_05080, partial [Gammaproteobacteria bacterium]|nr:hypothetical protein [Gammaproteobacteria bacterium]